MSRSTTSALRGLAVLPVLCGLALPASAQERFGSLREDPEPVPRSLDVNLSVGGSFSTDWSDMVLLGTVGGVTGAFQQVLVRDLSVDPAEAVSVGVTYWEGRLGFRTQAGFSRSCLAVGAACTLPDTPDAPDPEGGDPFLPPDQEVNINTWTLDAGGMIRLRSPEEKQAWAPYVTFGWGGVVYDPDDDVAALLPRFVDAPRQEPVDDNLIRVIVDDTQGFVVGVDQVGFTARSAWMIGAGTDIRVPLGDAGLGLRVELTSHTVRSPLRFRVLPLEGRRDGIPQAAQFQELDFDPVHNLRLTVGVIADIPLGETLRR